MLTTDLEQVRHAYLHRQPFQAHMRLATRLNKAGYLGFLTSLFNPEEERCQHQLAP